jgi:dienelactone hydrolase
MQRDLESGSAQGADGNPVSLRLDLYQPAGDTAARRPAVIWVHGGGFTRGSRLNPKIVELSNFYARLGYVSAAISYRLLAPDDCSPGVPECVAAAIAAKHDAQAAVRWLRSQASSLRVDVDRIAIGGFSAGAVTSLLVGTGPEDPGSSGNPGFSSRVQGVISNCGGLPGDQGISAGDAPVSFFHGTADRLVPPEWAESNFAALWAVDVPAQMHMFQGAGHCPNWEQYGGVTREQSSRFLYYVMGLPGPG